MADDSTLTLSAAFDRDRIWWKGDSVRYLVATVTAPDAPVREDAEPRKPLNLALVLDRSGSMAGAPLEAAREAARGVVETLHPEDHLSVVLFDSEIELLLPPTRMNHDGKTEARERLGRVEARSMTHLAGGWATAAELLSEMADGGVDARHRIVLLTDGMANVGITEPHALASMASGMRERGIYTSAVGIGDHYDPTQIEVLAEHGGGRLHDAQFPHEIVEVVSAELEETRVTTADGVEVALTAPEAWGVKLLSQFPLRTVEGGGAEGGPAEEEAARTRTHVAALGQMTAGRTRTAVFQVTFPAGRAGDTTACSVVGAWTDPETGRRDVTPAQSLSLEFVHGTTLKGVHPDPALGLTVLRVWQADLVVRLTALNRDGAYDRVQALAQGEGAHFMRYCGRVPGSEPLAHTVERLMGRAAVGAMSERGRKEMWLHAKKSSRGERDFRVMERPALDDLLDQER